MGINNFFIKRIKFYQSHKLPGTPPRCVHYPTCSNYAIECYQKFNFFYASILSIKRIMFCTKLNKKYYDPVPLSKKERKELKEKENEVIDIKDIILEHYHKYPKMEICDYLKLIYQNSFGPLHLINLDPSKIEYYIEEEKKITINEKEFLESIGNGFSRLHIGKNTNSKELSNKILNSVVEENYQQFYLKINILIKMIKRKELPLKRKNSLKFIQNYLMEGSKPIHHSLEYNQNYKVHYRVIKN